MVWWLVSADSSGPGPFYFTAPGTYSVGRKDCTITIQTDKSISRLHAEITVEAAPPLLAAEKDRDNLPRCKVVLKDLSKFGTFVNKDIDPRPVNTFPDKEAILKEGDVVTFGTNLAVFRLQYVPIILCMPSSTFSSTTELRSKAEAVGAYVFDQWNNQCTHLLVEEASPVTDLVTAAVMSRKPVLLLEWLQALMSQPSPRDQLPTFSRYIPTLKMNSGGQPLPTPIAEPLARGETLTGYTVFLQKDCLYDNLKLPSLVNAAGGVVKVFTEDNLKDIAGLVQQDTVLVFSAEQASKKDWFGRKVLTVVKHLSPASEDSLLRSILSAKLDLSLVSLSPAASVDTDETIDEESVDKEDDSASSLPQPKDQATDLKAVLPPRTVVDKLKKTATLDYSNAVLKTSSEWHSPRLKSSKYTEEALDRNATLVDSSNRDFLRSGAAVETSGKEPDKPTAVECPPMAIPKVEVAPGISDEVRAEIIFSNILLVRRDRSASAAAAWNGAVPNFKRFKKAHTASGNSFSTLVPFAKEPYRESSYKKEMGDYVIQEKKRKAAEKAAEDLFEAEKLKRKRVTAVKEARASLAGAG
ncbi:unnamed protein product [Calypogeia fissa]